jgi:hypothetical protein
MIQEQDIRDALNTIRQVYINPELAEKAATSIEEFIATDLGKLRMQNTNVDVILGELNALIATTTHDAHFWFGLAARGSGSAGNSGIIRMTPHFIQISDFTEVAAIATRQEYLKALAQFADPVIIDLRWCSGGDGAAIRYFLSPFFPDGTPLFTARTRSGVVDTYVAKSTFSEYQAPNQLPKYTGGLKVFVNGKTFSAAEHIAKILQSNGRAKVYGVRTPGACNVTSYMNFGGLRVSLPSIKIIDAASGDDCENIGVIPDYGPQTREYISTVYLDITDALI